MAQNRSSAVMQQRAEANDSLDDFPTPPWATRAICNFIARRLTDRPLSELSAREPCANRGHMVRPLQEYFSRVIASDVHDYGLGVPIADFLFPIPLAEVDWTIINPPFRLAEEFIVRSLDTSKKGVAVVCRSGFLEGEKRFERLFNIRPPSYVLQFCERVVMLKGRLVRSGDHDPSPENPNRKASTASSCSALIWAKDMAATKQWDWIEPCRNEFEVDGDYPSDPRGLAKLHRKVDS